MPLRRFLPPIAFAATAIGIALLSAPPAYSQAGAPTDESFESADGVKLNARFYKALKAKNQSCVLLLPGYKKDPTKGDWDGLAKKLAGEGFNVLLLHYRGHGKSTDINGKEFFGNPVLGPINAKLVSGSNKNPPRSSLAMSDLKTNYLPMLVNDIMAARSFLERKNDDGQVNVSTMYIIGAGDAAPLGLLYTAAEWHREAERPNVEIYRRPFINGNLRPNGPSVGKDIAAAIWLSPERPASFTDDKVKNFIIHYAMDMRTETRMLFIHGEKDEVGKKGAKYFHDEVMVAKGKTGSVAKMELTEIRSIKGAKLGGVDLLGNNVSLGTEDMILKYLQAIEDDRKGKARFPRQYTAPLPVALQTFGINP